MQDGVITITSEGSIRFLNNEVTASLVTPSTLVRRASNVEPVNPALRRLFYALRRLYGDKTAAAKFTRLWPCLWRVNLAPVGGPVLPYCWYNRSEAINAEIVWLNKFFI
jgi:hypothetical protein